MHVVVPFCASDPKTRLAPVLSTDERRAFAEAMLADVLAVIAACDHESTVVADAPVDCESPVVVDDRSLSTAVNARLPETTGEDPVAVVMADLALATPGALARLFEPEAGVVVAPGRGGGTNALVVRHPDFRVDYHGVSVRDHRQAAASVGADVATVDSYRLSTDVDEPADLVEVLLHAGGDAATWLREAGFEVAATDGRVTAERP